MNYRALIMFSSFMFCVGDLKAAEICEKNLTPMHSLPVATTSEMPKPVICLPMHPKEEQTTPVSSPVSFEDDSNLDTPYVGDKPYFHIINETDKTIPISLIMTVWNENKHPYERRDLVSVDKKVKAHSECSIMESECVLFKWVVDAYKVVQPQKCSFNAMLIFNSKAMTHRSPKRFSCSVAPCFNLSHLTQGVTYKLIPNGEDSFEYITVKPEDK